MRKETDNNFYEFIEQRDLRIRHSKDIIDI